MTWPSAGPIIVPPRPSTRPTFRSVPSSVVRCRRHESKGDEWSEILDTRKTIADSNNKDGKSEAPATSE